MSNKPNQPTPEEEGRPLSFQVRLPEQLLRAVRLRAILDDQTVTDVATHAIRAYIRKELTAILKGKT